MPRPALVPAILLLALAPLPAEAVATPLAAPPADDAAARALVAELPRATFVNDRNGDKIFDELETAFAEAPSGATLPVLVSFTASTPSGDGLARVLAVAPEAAAHRTYWIVPGFAGTMKLDDARRAARLPEVRQIELSHPAAPELDTATAFMGADAAVDALGVTGEGVTIAVLDTGLDARHVDLSGGKIVRFVDMTTGEEKEANDYDGHGTHVASIAAGLGIGEPEMRGVAPAAKLVGLQIADEDDAIAAYEYVVEHHEALGIRIATMSFGFGRATDGTSALERAVDAAWDAGIVCFKSNGNSGPGRGTMTVPAAARGILGIGSMLDPHGAPSGLPLVGNPGLPLPGGYGFLLSSYSSRGPTADGRIKPDLLAPGQAIRAAANGTQNDYITLSGTSMAAPFAAGTAALILHANPALSPDDTKRILTTTAEDWGLTGPDIDYGHGRIRVREATRLALAEAGAPIPTSPEPPLPYHETQGGVVEPPFYENNFEVNDTTHPIAGTFIAESTLVRVDILDPTQTIVGQITSGPPSRQITTSFQPQQTGTYTYRVVATPGTAFTVDFSHGLAPSIDATLPHPNLETLNPATTDPTRTLPHPTLLATLAILAILALATTTHPRKR